MSVSTMNRHLLRADAGRTIDPAPPESHSRMNAAIEFCLRASTNVPALQTVADWWPRWKSTAATRATPIEQAIAGGFDADRVGWAFASGYQAALRALVPDLPEGSLVALCVTEEAGNRPRDIRTTFSTQADGGVSISGSKRWTTLGPDSTLLLIVGALEGAGTRPALKVARVATNAPGVTLHAMPETRFVPEVPHASVSLNDVRVGADALLPGDGYEACVKPFRTIEDIHVTVAVLAYLLREARQRDWPVAFSEQLVAAMTLLADLACGDAGAASVHVALAGALRWVDALYAEASAHWASAADDAGAVRWHRDAKLFEVASAARRQRPAKAWERLRG